MPVLQHTSNSISDRHLKEFARLGEELDMVTKRLAIGIIPAQNVALPLLQISSSIQKMVEPIRLAQEAMERAFLPIKIIQDSLNASILPLVNAMDAYAETHRRMFESVSLLGLNNISQVGLGIRPRASAYVDIIDGEVSDSDEENSFQVFANQQAITVSPPQALVPVIPNTRQYEAKPIMGLKEIAGKSFQYKRKTLKKLSHRNCEGRLLSLFLASKDLFISDTDIYNELNISDGRSFSWVLRNLKRKFRTNGLSVSIERRWNPDGYILIDVSYLQ